MLTLLEHCNLPVFGVNPEQICILQTPQEFYNTILKHIDRAKRRIILSTLYIGTGHLEVELVNAIKRAATERNLEVNILIDASRGLRCSSVTHRYAGVYQRLPESPTAGQTNVFSSSVDLLRSLTAIPGVSVHLYHNPRLRGWFSYVLPTRLNEVLGVQHIKAYVFDDSVLLSGNPVPQFSANLSHEYFVSRQDRVWLFDRFPALADFYAGLVRVVGQFCYRLAPDGSLQASSTQTDPARAPLGPYMGRLQSALRAYMDGVRQTAYYPTAQAQFNTFVSPLVQFGPYGVRAEERFTTDLLNFVISDRNHRYQLDVASGYFNLTDFYAKLLVDFSQQHQHRSRLHLLCASPIANGFLNSRGLSGYIPMAYRESLINLLNRFGPDSNQDSYPTVLEYTRPNWTFHAKGLWLDQHRWHTGDRAAAASNPPSTSFTLVGSSNFSYRSLNRDLESQVAVWTTDPGLRARMREERDWLFATSFSQPVLLSKLMAQTQYRLPWYLRVLFPILHTYM